VKKYYFLLSLILLMLIFLISVLFVNARDTDKLLSEEKYSSGENLNIITY